MKRDIHRKERKDIPEERRRIYLTALNVWRPQVYDK